jgi:ATP-dependent protease ClpP protease subunit
MSNILNKKTRNQKHDIVEEVHCYDVLIDTREIFIHGDVDGSCEDSGVDFRMASKFIKNIRILEHISSDPIIIHQHSIGGNWDAGMMIYDAIINSSCYIIFIMHGTACSMGSIVPQAADLRIISPNCTFMVHLGYSGIYGYSHKQAQAWAEMEKHINNTMLDIYVNVAMKGKFFIDYKINRYDKIKKYILNKINQKDDWWLFAKDAVLYGFADGVLGDGEYESIEYVRNNIENGKSYYK